MAALQGITSEDLQVCHPLFCCWLPLICGVLCRACCCLCVYKMTRTAAAGHHERLKRWRLAPGTLPRGMLDIDLAA